MPVAQVFGDGKCSLRKAYGFVCKAEAKVALTKPETEVRPGVAEAGVLEPACRLLKFTDAAVDVAAFTNASIRQNAADHSRIKRTGRERECGLAALNSRCPMALKDERGSGPHPSHND